jgi:hypothetical protein
VGTRLGDTDLLTDRAEPQQQRIVVLSGLFDVIESEARVEDRVEEVSERKMVDADAPAEAVSAKAEPGTVMPPTASAIAGMKEVWLTRASLDRWAQETGMHADIDEATAGTKDTCDLGKDGAGVLEVGVCQDRDDRVERGIGERQPNSVDLKQDSANFVGMLLGYGELVCGDIDADDRPAETL